MLKYFTTRPSHKAHPLSSFGTRALVLLTSAMSSFGTLFRVTTFGESHCPAVGCIVDGVPPRMALTEDDIQVRSRVIRIKTSAGHAFPHPTGPHRACAL